ncbi:cyanophycinase [Bermanella sp. R86510]|uniref:cyanophycinase n=1 Tax=unclassified Bermanella TaxID=2627862 RepID=UPI0037C61C75
MRFLIITTLLMASHSHSFEFEKGCGDFTFDSPQTSAALMLSGGAGGNKPGEKSATQKWLELSGGGDLVVLRSNGTGRQAKWLCSQFPDLVKSAAEISIDSIEDANHPLVNKLIKNSEVIWIAGGDQNRYEDFWKGTALAKNLNQHIKTKAIGGTSAGMAILGQTYYAPRHKKAVIGSELLNNPYHKEAQDLFHADLINHPLLENTYNETHVDRTLEGETRHSRMAGFLARAQAEQPNKKMKAIGLNEGSYLVADEFGIGQTFGNKAYFLNAKSKPENLTANTPINWVNNKAAIEVYEISGNGESGNGDFSLLTWRGFKGGKRKNWFIEDGKLRP